MPLYNQTKLYQNHQLFKKYVLSNNYFCIDIIWVFQIDKTGQ